MLLVRFESPDPKQAATVVNTLVDNYIEYNFRTKYDASRQATGWMEQRLEEMLAPAQVKTEVPPVEHAAKPVKVEAIKSMARPWRAIWKAKRLTATSSSSCRPATPQPSPAATR